MDMMSSAYQIKSTPFFRRMLNASKKNGQLQRLKEEYERIKDFNERSIDMRMRQVRLKRLFREIEELKESSSVTQNKRRRINEKSQQERRIEAIIKAKELGNEISRVNGMAMQRRLDSSPATLTGTGGIPPPPLIDSKKACLNKRITLGNEISRANMIAIQKTREKRKCNSKLDLLEKQQQQQRAGSAPTSSTNVKQAKLSTLQKRLEYGNKCHTNAKRPVKAPAKQKVAAEQVEPMLLDAERSCEEYEYEMRRYELRQPSLPDVAQNSAANDSQKSNIGKNNSSCFKTFEQLQRRQVRMPTVTPPPKNDEDAKQRARKRWHRIGLLVRYRFDKVGSARVPLPLDQTNDDDLMAPADVQEDFEMLSLSEAAATPLPPEFEEAEEASNFSDLPLPPPPLDALAMQVDLTVPEPLDELLDVPDLAAKIVKQYEPLVRQTAAKEAIEFGVNHLRNIFEHSN